MSCKGAIAMAAGEDGGFAATAGEDGEDEAAAVAAAAAATAGEDDAAAEKATTSELQVGILLHVVVFGLLHVVVLDACASKEKAAASCIVAGPDINGASTMVGLAVSTMNSFFSYGSRNRWER